MSKQNEGDYEENSFGGGSAESRSEGLAAGGWLMLLCGAAAGAALMYFLDPDRGRTRRALVRDKVVGVTNDIGDAVGKTARDLRNRARGVVAEAGSALCVTGGRDEQSGGPQHERQPSANA
ncbi:MAG: hypothetical protein M3362_05345 [Acidobacteriota bacterium]|nr:hypothetical protein [Acidobacteriota bacterium]